MGWLGIMQASLVAGMLLAALTGVRSGGGDCGGLMGGSRYVSS